MLTLLQVKYFYHLARIENISQTAKSLGISQTSLSGMISKLEEALGLPLFDRGKNTLRLNEAGRAFYPSAAAVVQALESGQRAVMDAGKSEIREISFGVRSTFVWQDLIIRFQKQHPEYQLRLYDRDFADIRQMLTDGKLDLAIAGMTVDPAGLHFEPIGDDTVYLVVPAGHPLAKRESVSFNDIRHETFIQLSSKTGFARHLQYIFREAGFSPRYVIECDYLMRASLVEAGFGVAITSSRGKASDLLAPNRYIPITDPFATWQLHIAWDPGQYMSRAAERFRDYLLEELNTKEPLS